MLDINFKNKFRLDDLLIKETEFWIISLRPKQITIGSLILSLKRNCNCFSKITNEESEDLSNAFQFIEKSLKSNFEHDKVNYLALMMVDNQVHFHVIPRYENLIVYKGLEYLDKNWPKPPALTDTLDINEDTLQSLVTTLKQ